MEHLSSNLKKGGIKDLLAFFPANKRHAKTLDTHFRSAGLPQVADWFAKRQAIIAKETMLRELHERLESDDSNEQVNFCDLSPSESELRSINNVDYRIYQRTASRECTC